jgi:hypothetical protein
MLSEQGILEIRTLISATTWVGHLFLFQGHTTPHQLLHKNTPPPPKKKKKKAKIINYNTLVALTHVCGINN